MKAHSHLVSLFDMLKIYAHSYIELGQAMSGIAMVLYMAECADDGEKHLKPDEVADLRRHLERMSAMCSELEMKVAKAGIERALVDPPKTQREFDMLTAVVSDELRTRLFFFVPSNRAEFFERKVNIEGFPTASTEFIRAGNCFTVAEYTACVFHAMRAVEVGLDAVHKNLGLPSRNPADRSWGRLCADIRDAIAKRGREWEGADQYSAIYATLVAVKDSWRNQTMHVASSYDESQAKQILENSNGFIERLSALMDEAGQPAA